MINAVFTVSNGLICSYEISGHSDFSEQGSDIVCSAVSSAAYMAANTVTDIIGDFAAADVRDGYMRFEIKNPCESSKLVLEGLRLHLKELSKQYGKRLSITEV